ncbi:MAG: hypothetical protein Fur0037_14630 [Planctomycetota bacterium]
MARVNRTMSESSRTMRQRILLAVIGASAMAAAQRTPEDSLETLRAGNERFVAGESVAQPLGEGFRRSLARGQSPYAIVLTCSDSRVAPEHIFNAGLGDLFVIRVAGNTCDPETLASIEYAAEHLATPLCVVLGHENCGAVSACLSVLSGRAKPESQALAELIEHLTGPVRRALDEGLSGKEARTRAEEENARQVALDCLRRSPLLRRLARDGSFRVVPARYHLDTGAVEWLPEKALVEDRPEVARGHAKGEGLPPHVALQMLRAGHRRFLSSARPGGDISAARREALTAGQHPFAVVLTCSDSRVAPEHLFDAGLGDLFVVRVAGNVLNEEALASIEYAAAHAGASLLVVLGHSSCGAVTAAAHEDGGDLTSNMRALLTLLEPAVERALRDGEEDLVDRAVRWNALRTARAALARSAILRELESIGLFAVVPAFYDIASGDIEWLRDEGERAVETEARSDAHHGRAEIHTTPMGETASPAHGDPAHGDPAREAEGRPPLADDPPGHLALGALRESPDRGEPHGIPWTHGTADHERPSSEAHGPRDEERARSPSLRDHEPGKAPRSERVPSSPRSERGGLLGSFDTALLLGACGMLSLIAAALIGLGRRG